MWGPGDSGLDELLVQYDRWGTAGWAIQDTGGDLVALCDLGGPAGAARVVGQWTYDAYGAVLSADHLHALALPRLGHKGLFLDRLDVGIVTYSGGPESPRLIPFAQNIYHSRNRTYNPALGRFMQRDPNDSAMALLSTASHGRGGFAVALAFDMQGMMGDGANLYEYLGSNPWQRTDPLGLEWDPFDIVDEFLAESMGSRAAFLNQIGQSAATVAVVTATIVSYLPFPFIGSVGDLALYALGEETSEATAMAVGLGIVPGGKLIGKLGGFLTKIGAGAWRSAKHYALKYGPAILRAAGSIHPLGLAARALRYVTKACGCFEPDTPVWTVRGMIPISQVEVGDWVMATDEATGSMGLREVLRTFVRRAAPIVAVTVTTAAGASETLRTTEEHPFRVGSSSWTQAGSLQVGDTLRTLSGPGRVVSVQFTGEQETVHNFEVEGVHNYRVGITGILVHNTGCKVEYHHFFPIHFWPVFKDSGFTRQELNNIGKFLPQDLHKRVHGKGFGMKGAWNDRWDAYLKPFKKKSRKPSKDELWNFMESLKREFGIAYGP